MYIIKLSPILERGGRTLYFEKSTGEYIYGMDDDAVVDFENDPDFFVKAIEILDRHRYMTPHGRQIVRPYVGKKSIPGCIDARCSAEVLISCENLFLTLHRICQISMDMRNFHHR